MTRTCCDPKFCRNVRRSRSIVNSWSASLKVRFCELDAYNHVNNGVYMFYLDHARDEYFVQAMEPYPEMRGDAIRYVVAHAEIDYRAPAVGGDELEIPGEVSRFGRTSLTFHQQIVRPRDRAEIACARTVLVWTDPSGRPIPLPDPVCKAFG
jgi:acyl-CoA thioester hydrolase